MHHLPGVVPLYTAVEMRTVDRVTVDEIGIPGAVLMERAGMGAAAEVLQWFPDARRIAVVCGSGNNGGDGFVAARHLAAAGRDVAVLLVEGESKIRREPRAFLEVLKKLDVRVERINVTKWRAALDGFDLVVDAMLGTGVSGAPKPPFEAAIRAITDSLLPVVSLDIPSGVDASDGTIEGAAIEADLTVTFHAPKIGLAVAPGRFHAGRVKAVDIGIPVQVEEPVRQGIATRSLLATLPGRRRSGSKYDARVAVIGGSLGMSGAIALTAQAAMRGGAGICWAGVPDRIAEHLDIAHAEVQFRGVHSDEMGRLTVAAAERLDEIVDRADAVVFGPGVGDSDQVRALARWAVRTARVLVLDAQGISAFAGDTQALAARDGAPTLLTPHEGELGTLLGVTSEEIRAHRLDYAREAARLTQATVLLKGEDTIVCLPGGDFLVCGGHRAQATAGTGDVLAGVAAALLARGLDPALAGACAALGCSIAAGHAAAQLHADGVIASDLLDRIPGALAGTLGSEEWPAGAGHGPAPASAASAAPPRAEVRIDLSAYRRNVMSLRDRLSGDAQLWAVVKANAYGHDVDRLAQEAVAAGARRLCVATLSEARQLRQNGIRTSMLIMGPLDEPSVRRAVDLQVSVAVLGEDMLAGIERAAAGRAWSGRRPARVHLKVDTGMGRWGVSLADADRALERLAAIDGVEVEGIMTHFATADVVDDDGFFELQLERFAAFADRARAIVPGVIVHAANSAATLRDDRSHFDAVRCGVATYGLDPMQQDPHPHGLEPILSLRSHVAHVTHLEPGESTGYGRTWIADSRARIARVPIGYADGVRRALGNRGRVIVRGVERDIVGTVSMDHVSLLVDDDVRAGDVVTILGRDGDAWIGAEHHARWSDTINYEVTCGIADEPRLLRAHVQGA